MTDFHELFLLEFPKSSFQIEDFESSKILSLIGEDTIISQTGPLLLAQSNDSKSSMRKDLLALKCRTEVKLSLTEFFSESRNLSFISIWFVYEYNEWFSEDVSWTGLFKMEKNL